MTGFLHIKPGLPVIRVKHKISIDLDRSGFKKIAPILGLFLTNEMFPYWISTPFEAQAMPYLKVSSPFLPVTPRERFPCCCKVLEKQRPNKVEEIYLCHGSTHTLNTENLARNAHKANPNPVNHLLPI